MDAVVLVHKADSPLGRARIAILRHLHDELVATGGTLGVARVLGEDEEGNLHAELCGRRGVETGTKRETVLRRGVGEVPEPHLVDSPALVVDVETHFHLHGAEVFEVGGEAGDLCGVHEGTLGDHLVLPRLEAHLDLLRLLELHAMNGDLRLAEHRADVGRDVEHCVRRADDGAHIERPGIAEPSVRPPAKQEHLARLRIVRHRGVLSRDGRFADGRGCVPDHRSAIHNVHLVQVGVLALLSGEAEHLVVGHRLNRHQLMVRNLHRVGLGLVLALIQPRHRLEIEMMHVRVHRHVVAPAEDGQSVGEPRHRVVETRRRSLPLQRELGPPGRHLLRHRLRFLQSGSEVEDVHVIVRLPVAAITAEDVKLVADDRRGVMRARRRNILRLRRFHLELRPRLVLRVVDPHVVISHAMVQTAEDDEEVLHGSARVSRARGRSLARNLACPLEHIRVVQVQRVEVTERARLACERTEVTRGEEGGGWFSEIL